MERLQFALNIKISARYFFPRIIFVIISLPQSCFYSVITKQLIVVNTSLVIALKNSHSCVSRVLA